LTVTGEETADSAIGLHELVAEPVRDDTDFDEDEHALRNTPVLRQSAMHTEAERRANMALLLALHSQQSRVRVASRTIPLLDGSGGEAADELLLEDHQEDDQWDDRDNGAGQRNIHLVELGVQELLESDLYGSH
jgi:hypothetical protein